jgi:geranylgeranyl reductase family protein
MSQTRFGPTSQKGNWSRQSNGTIKHKGILEDRMYDVTVVGAGPAGCRAAELISKNGYDVLILEEHSNVGKPVQCTGLVSKKIGRLPKELIVNKIKKARFLSKNAFFEIKSKHPVFVINREKFDKYRAANAKKSGAKFKLSTRFIDFKNYQSKLFVGADGPNSTVAKLAGIKLPNNLLFAVQVRAKYVFDPHTVELWFGSDIAPGLFAWVVPENEEIARVGLMSEKNPNQYLEKFLKMRFEKINIFDRLGDIIRFGLIKSSVSDRVLLVGDAACQVKPFSAGGIIYGQIGAKHAADACVKSLESNDFSKEFLLDNYDKEWKKELEGPIKKGILFKKIFSKIGDKPYSFRLIKNFGIDKLSNFFDMDFLGKN